MIKNEPVLVAVTALIAAVAGVLVAFGVPLTDIQTAALVQLAEAAYGIAFLVRSVVTPTAKLRAAPAPPPAPAQPPPPATFSPPVAG